MFAMQRVSSLSFTSLTYCPLDKEPGWVDYFHVLQTITASESFFHEFNDTSIVESLYSWQYEGPNPIFVHFLLLAIDLGSVKPNQNPSIVDSLSGVLNLSKTYAH